MTPPKRLPYKYGGYKDDALMCNAEARKQLIDLLRDENPTKSKMLECVAKALDAIHRSNAALKEIKIEKAP